jgi:hypothetical protein
MNPRKPNGMQPGGTGAIDIKFRMITNKNRPVRRNAEVLQCPLENGRIRLGQAYLAGNQDSVELMLQPGGNKFAALDMRIAIADQPHLRTTGP